MLSHQAPSSRTSLYAWFFCCCFILLVGGGYYPKWRMAGTEATISWDVSGYYFYLPAIFIYHDLEHAAFRDAVLTRYQPTPDAQQGYLLPNGRWMMKYSAGLALLYSPFFLATHLLTWALAPDLADGFSWPYQLGISVGSWVVALLGLWWLRRNLLAYFADRVVALVLLLLVLGTNYLDYAAINGAMTHNFLFTLQAGLILATRRFYQRGTWTAALGIGAAIGLAALTRPTEILVAILPLLWGLDGREPGAWRARLAWWYQHRGPILAAVVLVAAIGSIQLVYWKTIAGQWLVYSYQEQSFNWLQPHLYLGILSDRSGWLVYTPLMVFSLVGLVGLYRRHRPIFWAGLLFSLAFIYITFAWDIWWYGGALGQRAMVQAYAILAFPLAAWVEKWLTTPHGWRWLGGLILLLFTYYNLWLTHQAHRGGLYHAGQMTREYFWRVLGRYRVEEGDLKLLDNNEFFRGDPPQPRLVYSNDFEADTSSIADCGRPPIEGQRSLCVGPHLKEAPSYFFVPPTARAEWLRATAVFRCGLKEYDPYRMGQFIVGFYRGGRTVKEKMIRIHRHLNNGEVQSLFLDVRFPNKPYDRVGVKFWNAGSPQVFWVDLLTVETFNASR